MDSGLALTAGLLQSPYFLDYEGFQRREPEGLGVRGYSALSRLYKAADGWVYLHCPDGNAWRRMTELPEFSSLRESPFEPGSAGYGQDGELAAAMARIIEAKPCEIWAESLSGVGVGVTRNLGTAEFSDDSYVRGAGLIVTREQPGWGRVGPRGEHGQSLGNANAAGEADAGDGGGYGRDSAGGWLLRRRDHCTEGGRSGGFGKRVIRGRCQRSIDTARSSLVYPLPLSVGGGISRPVSPYGEEG